MEHFVAYHSAHRMGYEFQSSEVLRFYSKKTGVLKKAIGNTVWVVQGIPKGARTAYTLCGAYLADQVSPEAPSSDVFVISGKRIAEFPEPITLNGFDWFPALLKSQSNFSLGFNRLSEESTIKGFTTFQVEKSELIQSTSVPKVSATEGERRLVTHFQRERDRTLVEAKKAEILKSRGALACEACNFDFFAAYGEIGEGFCEVHHLAPLSDSNRPVTTTLADLAVLCSNCHSAIHRSAPMLSVRELSEIVRKQNS